MSSTLNLTELREGGSQDLSEVSAIMQDAFDARFGEAWTSAQCLGMLSLPGVWLVIASLDGSDAGFALARSTGDEAELLLLATRPAARRRGSPERCCAPSSPKRRARSHAIHLEVRAGNDAVRLYRREGFEKVGERKNYYRGKTGQRLTPIPTRASFADFFRN
jgi:ribosomal-protein-alanine N-acetyltransferase